MISCGAALFVEGVSSVRPRLLGFRFGGVGGLTNADDAPFDRLSLFGAGKGRLVVDAAREVPLDVSTARFLRFRPFFGGACFCSSKNGRPSSEVCGRIIPVEKEAGGGDSGEEPGDGSVALESSTVEIVVVGDEVFDPLVESLIV